MAESQGRLTGQEAGVPYRGFEQSGEKTKGSERNETKGAEVGAVHETRGTEVCVVNGLRDRASEQVACWRCPGSESWEKAGGPFWTWRGEWTCTHGALGTEPGPWQSGPGAEALPGGVLWGWAVSGRGPSSWGQGGGDGDTQPPAATADAGTTLPRPHSLIFSQGSGAWSRSLLCRWPARPRTPYVPVSTPLKWSP